ncbi:MAG: hypothetical protein QTN59_05970 [Candidatus Electrothrix communis]|nr:MAG: hypothetical protein QTN59_05970 [Candidatus Electrothrix communis]
MSTIQWRPEINFMTVPQSYWMRFVPRKVVGKEDLAADIALRHPDLNEDMILTILNAEDEAIQERLLNGDQVTKEGGFSYSISFSGRLDSPDDPLPDLEESLQVSVRVSPPFVAALRQGARAERLPMTKKLPLIMTAEDTLLKLNDVLNPQGVLQLKGDDLYFDPEGGSGGCIIEGTRSGSAMQTHFPMISSTSVMLMPEIPAQPDPWNNEYRISIRTHYSEHGTLCSGTYGRMLRLPLTLTAFGYPNPPEVGILTGSADSPYVSVISGAVSEDEILRIQVILDQHQDRLLFSLLDMKKDDGAAGAEVIMTGNGELTLSGFPDSAVTELNLRVNEYAALKEMIRNDYSGRLVDMLDIKMV